MNKEKLFSLVKDFKSLNLNDKIKQEYIYSLILKEMEGVTHNIANKYNHSLYEFEEKTNDIRYEIWLSLLDFKENHKANFLTYSIRRCHVKLLHHIRLNLDAEKRQRTINKDIQYINAMQLMQNYNDEQEFHEFDFFEKLKTSKLSSDDKFVIRLISSGYSLKESVEQLRIEKGYDRSIRSIVETTRKRFKKYFPKTIDTHI